MTDQTISDMLRDRIKTIEDNYACFSLNDLKKLAHSVDVANILHIGIDDLQQFIQSKLK